MEKRNEKLTSLLMTDGRLVVEENIDKNKAAELARKYDPELLSLLQKDDEIKSTFFSKTDGGLIFKKDIFLQFLSNKEFLPDSFTAYRSKIGLATSTDSYVNENNEVVLNWPYKDCVLEGGQSKEDSKRKEMFFNEVLAPDEINRLLDPKVFTNWKRYDKDGEHKLDTLKNTDNLLIKGNNLIVLNSIKKRFAGKVKLIYIDPPFNTGNDSFNYNDSFNHSTWLTFMKNRIDAAKKLLSEDGNLFVHLDINESHYAKLLLDEAFGRDNFVEEIIWCYGTASGGRAAGAKPVNIHDYILHYAKNYSLRAQNKLFTEYSKKYIDDWFKYKDEDGRVYRRRMRGRDKNNNTVWEKQYLDESMGIPLTTVWTDIKQVYADPRAYKAGMEESTEIVKGFSGQKPEALIKRILEMSTNEGDIVLDYHLGTGTTAAVAHKMNRQYIGIEQLYYGENDAVERLKNVIVGDQTGISKITGWTGGGSFVYCNIENDANKFRERVEQSKENEIPELLKEVGKSSFLSYRIDPKKLDEKEFKRLSLADQKHTLLDLVDNNTLYVNYSDIDDTDYKISNEDKEFNKQFYNEK